MARVLGFTAPVNADQLGMLVQDLQYSFLPNYFEKTREAYKRIARYYSVPSKAKSEQALRFYDDERRDEVNRLLPRRDDDSKCRGLMYKIYQNNLMGFLHDTVTKYGCCFLTDVFLMRRADNTNEDSVRVMSRIYNVSLLEDVLNGITHPSFIPEQREFEVKNYRENASREFFGDYITYLTDKLGEAERNVRIRS